MSEIPQSRRPDGTLRKAIRVRPGFVPIEEQQKYTNPMAKDNASNARSIPGLSTRPKPDKVKESITMKVTPKDKEKAEEGIVDPAKRLKGLKKKLRQIESLIEVQQSMNVELNADQLSKVNAKREVEKEIRLLEK